MLEQAEEGAVSLLFLDASHFVMGCDFLGCIYGRTRRFVRTFSGRKRFHVLGAMDYRSKKVLTVTNDSYITASEVCDLLRAIAEEYGEKKVYLVLDNARYPKCKIVQQLAEQLHIQLLYIPPYSPNLNLMERLWKFVKGELRSQYYDDFNLFQHKILSIINSTHGINKSKIDNLIGKGVQLFHQLSPLSPNTLA